MIYCSHCGAKNVEGALFCASCGEKLLEDTIPKQTSGSKAKAYPPEEGRKLIRCSNDKILGGVCAGFAKYSNIDVDLVRILFILAFFFSGTLVFFAYLLLWAILPEVVC